MKGLVLSEVTALTKIENTDKIDFKKFLFSTLFISLTISEGAHAFLLCR